MKKAGIIFDGWSLGIVLRGILQHLVSDYDEIMKGKPAVDYRTYAQWSHKMLKEGCWDQELLFWKKQLSDPPLPLLIRRSAKNNIKPDEGARYHWLIPEPLFSRVKTFAQTHGVTRFSVMYSI